MEEKQEQYLQLSEKHRITSDGRLNLILQEGKYKRLGTHKDAELDTKLSYVDVGYFGAGLQSLIKRLNKEEFMQEFENVQRGQDVIEAFEEMKKYLEEREKRIYEHVKQHVTLSLKNSKENSID